MAFSSAAVAFFFTMTRGPVMLAVILPGLAGSWLYTAGKAALKYRALGEVTVFLVMGPCMFAGLSLALAGRLSPLVMALWSRPDCT